jgi:hypothetical protein
MPRARPFGDFGEHGHGDFRNGRISEISVART